MNIKSALKKIFNSYDFRGNRIKNLRVDTPDESIEYREIAQNVPNPDNGYFGLLGSNGTGGVQHFVANKLYVDKKTTLNTEKAWKWKNPFYFFWIKNVQGKPYKEIFDDLFFPLVEHEFISPEILNVDVFAIDRPLIDVIDKDNNFKKWVIYNNVENRFKLKIIQQLNDWYPTQTDGSGQIVIQYNDGKVDKTFNCNSENTFDLQFNENIKSIESEIEFGILWDNTINKIYFQRIYSGYRYRKNTYGNQSIPETTCLVKIDITEYFTKLLYPFTLCYENNGTIYTDKVLINEKSPKVTYFIFDKDFYNNGIFTKKYYFKSYIFNESDYLIDCFNLYPKDFITTNLYKAGYDFGYFKENVYVRLVPQAIRFM